MFIKRYVLSHLYDNIEIEKQMENYNRRVNGKNVNQNQNVILSVQEDLISKERPLNFFPGYAIAPQTIRKLCVNRKSLKKDAM